MTMTRVIPCDVCDAPLRTEPGVGLTCPNGCPSILAEEGPYDHLPAAQRGRRAPAPTPRAIAPAASPATSWEVFDVRWTKRGGSVVRLSKNGQLAIGEVLLEQLGKPDQLELLFDKAGRRVGLRKGSGPHAAKPSTSGKSTQVRVSLAGFLTHYGLPLPTKNLAIKAVVEGGVLVFGVDGLGAA